MRLLYICIYLFSAMFSGAEVDTLDVRCERHPTDTDPQAYFRRVRTRRGVQLEHHTSAEEEQHRALRRGNCGELTYLCFFSTRALKKNSVVLYVEEIATSLATYFLCHK